MMPIDRHERQLRVLAHPAILTALGALALNDFVLRRAWPSWFTGKLGDFAWLFAAPPVVAVIFALVADALRWGWAQRPPVAGRLTGDPAQGIARSGDIRCSSCAFLTPWNLSGAAGFVLIGGIFALAKTIPACNALVNAAAGALFGFPVAWRRDPTDLLALLALLPAWKLWTTGVIWSPRHPVIRSATQIRLPSAGHPLRRPPTTRYLAWLVVPLSMLLTMADSPQPRGDPGVYCLAEQNGDLIARTVTGDYLSRDGGLTWDLAPTPTPEPTWTPGPVTPDVATPGSAQLPRLAPAGGKAGLAAPRPSTQDRPAPLAAGGPFVAATGASIAGPAAALTLTLTPGTGQAPAATAAVTPTLDAGQAAQATVNASAMFIPHCAPRNPITDPNRPQIMYRYHQEDVIERSEDGGQTWHGEFWLQQVSEGERQTYAQGHKPSSYTGDNTTSVFPPRPLDALFDPASGDALFAMGHQGVLVRSADGSWWWATLGRYRHLGN
jgi:hypothetical protein